MVRKITQIILFLAVSFNFAAAQTELAGSTTETEKINDHLYKITCKDNNEAHVIASVGDDGVLLIDAGFTSTVSVLKEELEELGGQPKYVINTHAHLDHIGGNLAFGNSEIISQAKTKEMMTTGLYLLYAIPEYAIPVNTFEDEMTLSFNGDTIKLIHMPNSHTAGDAIVYFQESNVVALGDLVFPDWFPFIDLAEGGTLKNYTNNIQYFIDTFSPSTKFVTGHNRNITRDDLIGYKKMLDKTTSLVQDAINRNMSYDEMVAQDILKDWESYNSGPFRTIKKDYWIGTIYSSLTGDRVVGKPAVIGDVINAWMAGDVDASIDKYKSMKQSNPDGYDFNEAYLNAFGYYLMNRNKLDDAIEIFKLNADEYPQSGNVYDSLGEAYAKIGDNKSAVECYNKSLELDPGNDNARQKLSELRDN